MAFILHGSCHGHGHGHHHAHSHSHSHSPKPVKRHKFSTMTDDTYQPSDDEFIRNNNSAVNSQNMNGSGVLLSRSNSFCSYRSPNHSRTNSFSTKINSSHDVRKTSIPSASPTAMLQIKLTETLNHRNSFDGIIDKGSHHKHRHGDGAGKIECEISDEQSSEFSKKNINIQAAVIHVLGDFIQSIGVFVAAIVIKIYVSVVELCFGLCRLFLNFSMLLTTAWCKNSRSDLYIRVLNNRHIHNRSNNERIVDGAIGCRSAQY